MEAALEAKDVGRGALREGLLQAAARVITAFIPESVSLLAYYGYSATLQMSAGEE